MCRLKTMLCFLLSLLFVTSLCDAAQQILDDILTRYPRQIVDRGDGVVVKEWWIRVFYKMFPALFKDENSVPIPIMFLPSTDKLVYQLLQNINGWWPKILYEDNGAYSIHTLPLFFFGVNAFELVGISFLVFLASIALVVLILPSLYFRLMLYADYTTTKEIPSII